MPITYSALHSVTLTSAQATIQLTSIPPIYSDLILRVSTRYSTATAWHFVRVWPNAFPSGSDTQSVQLFAPSDIAALSQGASVGWTGATTIGNLTGTANSWSTMEMHIAGYATTPSAGLVLAHLPNNGAVAWVTTAAVYDNRTGSISEITIQGVNSDLLAAGTTVHLYGLRNA